MNFVRIVEYGVQMDFHHIVLKILDISIIKLGR